MTWECFAEAWPGQSDEFGFADKFNSMPKHVVSSTLSEPLSWENSHLLTGDPVDAVNALKRQDGGDIMVNGSARLVQALADHDLVDAYHLMVYPLILGAGKRLFGKTRERMPPPRRGETGRPGRRDDRDLRAHSVARQERARGD